MGWFWLICLGLGRSVRVVKLCCVCLKILRETAAAELFFLAIDFIVPLSTPLLLLYVCILVMIIRVHSARLLQSLLVDHFSLILVHVSIVPTPSYYIT